MGLIQMGNKTLSHTLTPEGKRLNVMIELKM